MRRRTSLRFLIEVAFLVIVAAVTGFAHLSATEIVLTMAGAFVAVVVFEVASLGEGKRAARDEHARVRAAGRIAKHDAERPAEPLWIEDVPARASLPVAAPTPPSEPRRVAEPVPLVAGNAAVRAPEAPRPAPPVPAAPVREAAPAPPAAHVPEPPPAPAPEPEPVVVTAPPPPVQAQPIQWNLFELQSRARAIAGRNPGRDEEWAFLFLYLREFSDSSGQLPVDFDGLVRESFADLIGGG